MNYYAYFDTEWQLVAFHDHYLIFQRFSKKNHFLRFFEKLGGNFFCGKRPFEIDVGHQFYAIKRDISYLLSLLDFSGALKKTLFL